MRTIDAKLCFHLMFQNSFKSIERQKHYRNFWGDRLELKLSISCVCILRSEFLFTWAILSFRPLARYGLPPHRGNFVDHVFLKADCLVNILQHVSVLAIGALPSN